MSNVSQTAPLKAMWDFLALSGGEVLGKIAGFLAFAYLARVLAPGDYGSVELTISLLTLCISIVEFGFGPIGSRDIARKPSEAVRLVRLIPTARVLIVLACYPLAIGLVSILDLTNETQILIIVTLLTLFTIPFNQQWLLQGFEKMAAVSLGQALHMVVFMAGVYLLINAESALYMVGVVEVVASLAMTTYFVFQQIGNGYSVGFLFEKNDLKKLYSRAFPVGLGKIVWTANHSIPTFLIFYYSTTKEVAWFAAAFRVVTALLSFSHVYHFNLYPSVVKRIDNSYEEFRSLCFPSYRLCAWVGVLVALAGSLLASPISILAFGDKFDKSALPLSLLVWLVPTMLLSSHSRWALIAKDKQQFVLYSQIIGLLVCIACCIILVPGMGSVGAAIAINISAVCTWFYSHSKATVYVGKIPATSLIKPMLVAGVLLYLNHLYADANFLWISLSLLIFILCAPVVDRKLVAAIKTVMHIKNEDPVSD